MLDTGCSIAVKRLNIRFFCLIYYPASSICHHHFTSFDVERWTFTQFIGLLGFTEFIGFSTDDGPLTIDDPFISFHWALNVGCWTLDVHAVHWATKVHWVHWVR